MLRIKNRDYHILVFRILISKNLELKLADGKKRDAYETLNKLLKMQIMGLINLGYEFGDEEDSVEFSLKSTVFISESVSVFLENDLLKK